VPLVLTQPDRPAGRGMKLTASPVKRFAVEHGLKVAQPTSLRRAGKYPQEAAEAIDLLRATPHDVMVVAAYGLILPQEVLDIPPRGAINIHASLLPRWRGAAPIQRAVLAGDAESGVTIMQMDAGLDTGPTLHSIRVGIEPRETAGSLQGKLAHAGAEAIVTVLRRLARGESVTAVPQRAEGVTYAAKIQRVDTVIDWRTRAQDIDRQVRAFHPTPGAVTAFAGQPVKVLRTEPIVEPRAANDAGTVLAADASGLVVACGDGALRLLQLQPAAGTAMTAAAFASGRRIVVGDRFDAVPPSPPSRSSH